MPDSGLIAGPSGQFRITSAGSKPEMGRGLFYESNGVHFYFHLDVCFLGKVEHDIDVFHASLTPFGPPLRMLAEVERKARENIRMLLNARSYSFPDIGLPGSEIPRNITFSWNFK